jgi:hypothetical protein
MFRNREQMWRRIQELVQKFKERGATTPEKALTAQELGLPPRFEQAMRRRLGQTGIFVETNGKYYLNEERLRQIQQQHADGAGGGGGGFSRQAAPAWLRYGGILLALPLGIIVVAFLVFYFNIYSGARYFPGEFILILLVVLLVLFVVRMLFWRAKRKYLRDRWMQNKTV